MPSTDACSFAIGYPKSEPVDANQVIPFEMLASLLLQKMTEAATEGHFSASFSTFCEKNCELPPAR
jgi:hypothetical protein